MLGNADRNVSPLLQFLPLAMPLLTHMAIIIIVCNQYVAILQTTLLCDIVRLCRNRIPF